MSLCTDRRGSGTVQHRDGGGRASSLEVQGFVRLRRAPRVAFNGVAPHHLAQGPRSTLRAAHSRPWLHDAATCRLSIGGHCSRRADPSQPKPPIAPPTPSAMPSTILRATMMMTLPCWGNPPECTRASTPTAHARERRRRPLSPRQPRRQRRMANTHTGAPIFVERQKTAKHAKQETS